MNRDLKSLRTLALLLSFVALVGCNKGTPEVQTESTASAVAPISNAAVLTAYATTLPLGKIKLPEGFRIDVYAEVENARSMTQSPAGILYVGNRNKDKVYAVQDTDGDGKADRKWVIASGLNSPNGVAFKDGDLYVAEISRILKFPGVESKLDNPGQPMVINADYPTETHHGWKYIAFGPDGKLYVPVGAPCNICESKDEVFASITRINADGSGREIVAKGVRNTVGFTWHPDSHEMWFTDNGRDLMGDDIPDCELNHAPKAGMHFGYPYCHEGSIKDPEFGSKHACSEFTAPVEQLGPHVAPLGLKFYTGNLFPASYKNQLFIARHGSWNRTRKSGYDISLVRIQNNKSVGHEVFASGWLDEATQEAWGRPVDVLVIPDGSMLVSDDKAGVIYRITYQK